MERLVGMVTRVIPTPAALVILLGDDRRSFWAGRMWRDWFAHDAGALIRCGMMQRTIDNGGTIALTNLHETEGDVILRSAAVELNIVSLAISTFHRSDGAVGGMICLLDDVARTWSPDELDLLAGFGSIAGTELELRHLLADREVREQKLRHDSVHDSLTGLPNRGLFMKRLSDATQRARRGQDGMFAVLFLDVDGFKLVNDSMGHHLGEEMLVTIARRLEQCVRGGDIVARLGGDEFAILLERINDVRDAAVVAERVQEAMKAPLLIGGYEHTSTASIGVALSTGANEQPEYVLRSADIAMYRAKNGGRGCYEMFDRAMHAEALTRLQIETDLRHAFDREEFFLHYQPMILLTTGEMFGIEALVRWNHPKRGMLPPLDFIRLSEESGAIIEIGRWVLGRACEQAMTWQAAYPNAASWTISVNVSAKQLQQADYVDEVRRILRETGIAPERLILEITESVMMQRVDDMVTRLRDLKELGLRLAIDGFGTGYSSLSYLQQFPFDLLKIDKSFIDNVGETAKQKELTRAIIELGKTLELEMVAEGIERTEQLLRLVTLDCDRGQGFLFSEPLEPGQIEVLLGEMSAAATGEAA